MKNDFLSCKVCSKEGSSTAPSGDGNAKKIAELEEKIAELLKFKEVILANLVEIHNAHGVITHKAFNKDITFGEEK